MQKVSIPRAFLEDNFDVDLAMLDGLQVQVLANGHELDTDIDNLFLYKYQVGAQGGGACREGERLGAGGQDSQGEAKPSHHD